MLKDEPIEFIKQQYEEKNEILGNFGEQVKAWTLYEDIFGDIDQEIPVVIIDEDEEKRIRQMSIADAVEFGSMRNDVLIGGCTYFNNWISKKSAKDIYTFIIDYDNAYSGTLLQALQNDWKGANGDQFAKPTYIVNSGTGLHLYFVLSEPIPCYHSMTQQIDKLYRSLAVQQSRRVYAQLQIQWFGQDFRCGGGRNKYNWENTIFRVGEKWDIDDLGRAVDLKDVHFIRYGEKRHTKKTGRRKRQKIVGWKSDRAFYDYALRNCIEKTKEGNRYMSMCALSAIAYKCGVDKEDLEADLTDLLTVYNKGAVRQVKPKEIQSALKMYCEKAMVTPRESLEHWQGWEYKPIKRNGRKRADHIKLMNLIRDEINHNTDWRNKDGRPTKKEVVEAWQLSNPGKTKAECHRDTNIDPKTIRKWWVEDWNQLKRNAEVKDAKTRRLMGYQNALKGDIM